MIYIIMSRAAPIIKSLAVVLKGGRDFLSEKRRSTSRSWLETAPFPPRFVRNPVTNSRNYSPPSVTGGCGGEIWDSTLLSKTQNCARFWAKISYELKYHRDTSIYNL